VIPAPFRFLEVRRELVGTDSALFSQSGFGKTPEGLDAVDVPLASGKFVFMMILKPAVEIQPVGVGLG
jgi:hypothetical protein